MPHELLGPSLLFALAVAALAITGCSTIPKGMASVDDVDIEGNEEIPASDIEERIATQPSQRFLGVFQGVVFDYSLFDQGVLQRDLERVERYYKARGYYEAKARAGRVVYTETDHVEVTIEVEEGPRTHVGEIAIVGMDGLTAREAEAVRDALDLHLEIGDPLEEESFREAERDMQRALTDRGFAWAKITRIADVDLLTHRARLSFSLRVGPRATFGAIRITGLKELPADVIRAQIDIDPGDEYSTDTIDEARSALLGLGALGSVDIQPVLPEPIPQRPVVDLEVEVREQVLQSLLLGGGFQLDSVRFQAHLRAAYEHRNLFGGFRYFLADLRPTLDLYPTRIGNFVAPTDVLPGERFTATLRQPSFLEARMTGVLSQQINTFPVLVSTDVDPDASVIGYFEYKAAAGVERAFGRVLISPTYNFQYDLPFAYRGALDPDLQGIVVSYIEVFAHLDLREGHIKPHQGVFIQADAQFAGIGGSARDFRIQPEIRGYIPLGRPVTLAARWTVGLLFPLSYGGAAEAVARGADPADLDRARYVRDIQLTYLRGFFSGGPSSNRGYPARGVGPHGAVPFFNPYLSAQQLYAGCAADSPDYDSARCAVPLGGHTLWELSLEMRYPIMEPLGGIVFCDASDVAAEQATFRFDHPHLSCGLGLRYDTPIGAARLDVGYRIPGAQFPSSTDPRTEGDPGTIFGAPIAIAIGLGEAF